MKRPNLGRNIKYDMIEEEARLKKLLREDFIDDLTSGEYVSIKFYGS